MKKILAILLMLVFLTSYVAVADEAADATDDSEDDTDIVKPDRLADVEAKLKRSALAIRAKSPEIKNETAVKLEKVEGKLRDRYNACLEKCKASESENCDVRCKGLMVAADRLNIIEDRLRKAEVERLRILDSSQVKKISALNKEELRKLAHLDRARLKEIAKLNHEALKNRLKELKLVKVKEKNLAKKRVLPEEKIKGWNEDFNKAKDKFLEEERLYKETKKEFDELKKKLKACEGQETEECKKLSEEALAKGKEFLMHSAEVAIEHLNKIKARVGAAENIDETEVAEIIQKIDAAIAELNAAKEKITAATTKEELAEAARTINSIWKKIKYNALTYASRVVHTRVGLIVKRAEKLEDKMHCAVSKMEENGTSVEEVNGLIDDFSAKVDSARDNVQKAEELLKKAREMKIEMDPSDERARQIKALLDEAKQLINTAHKDLKDSHELLKKIFRLIKASGVDITSCKSDELPSDEVYVVEEETETTVGEVENNVASEEAEDGNEAETESEAENEEAESAE